MNRILHIIGLVSLALPSWAGENITLRTGFALTADRHELAGDTIRIFTGDEVTEMPANLVASVETIEVPPKPEVAAPPAVPIEVAVEKREPLETTPMAMAQTAAHKYSLPDAFVAGVMRAESGFNPAAVSPKGAIGLMQLMPETARGLGVDPKNPNQNADGGTRYLRDLLARYENQPDQVVLALAAYNAGTAAVDKYHGVPPYRETREYILRVLKSWNPPPVAQSAAKESSQ